MHYWREKSKIGSGICLSKCLFNNVCPHLIVIVFAYSSEVHILLISFLKNLKTKVEYIFWELRNSMNDMLSYDGI